MNELQKRQRAFYLQEKKILAKILESMKDKAPICDCGKKMSYNPKGGFKFISWEEED